MAEDSSTQQTLPLPSIPYNRNNTEMVSEHTDLNIPLSDDFIVPTNNDVGAASRTDGGKLPSPSNRPMTNVLNEPCLYPENKCVYLCGNSLGLQSKTSSALIQEELDAWATRWVYFEHTILIIPSANLQLKLKLFFLFSPCLVFETQRCARALCSSSKSSLDQVHRRGSPIACRTRW